MLYVEAAIDFPDEEIDFMSDGKVASELGRNYQTGTKVLAEEAKEQPERRYDCRRSRFTQCW